MVLVKSWTLQQQTQEDSRLVVRLSSRPLIWFFEQPITEISPGCRFYIINQPKRRQQAQTSVNGGDAAHKQGPQTLNNDPNTGRVCPGC